ncbi:MAG: hypothetical protein JRG90_19060 [Deltaproteobacteria bacterium]|nr:hypothetical protein [Deltaproteobacteria bacterium]
MLRRSTLGIAALLGALVAGCVHGPLDVEALEHRYPAVAAIREHHLWDTTPYLLPSGENVVFFLCRWPTDAAIPVSLPPDASEEERRSLESVLRAWEGAGLGIRFETGAPPGIGIELRFIDSEPGATMTTHAANTVADCAVSPAVFESEMGEVLPARLVFASIHLWRAGFDNLGRPVEYSRAEFLGSALHELGHALGFQGHVRVGRSVMVKETDQVERAGVGHDKDRAFSDATLRALYALPSGAVVQRVPVKGYQTAPVDRMAALARKHDFSGPFVRVGDVDGGLLWRDPSGTRFAVRVDDVRGVLRGSQMLWLEPTIATTELLEIE